MLSTVVRLSGVPGHRYDFVWSIVHDTGSVFNRFYVLPYFSQWGSDASGIGVIRVNVQILIVFIMLS